MDKPADRSRNIIEKRRSIEKALAIAAYTDPNHVKSTIKRTSSRLTPDMFVDSQLGDFVCEIIDSGDVIKVATEPKHKEVFSDIVNYVRDTISVSRTVDDTETYLKEFWQALYAQNMYDTAVRLANAALDLDVDGAYNITKTASEVVPDQDNITYVTATDMARNTTERRREKKPRKVLSLNLPSGWDGRAGKLVYGNVMLLGGRTGMGKTAVLLQIAKSVALQRKTVLYCSTESSREVIWTRLCSTASGVPISNIVDEASLTPEEGKRYDDANEELANTLGAYLVIDDRSKTSDEIMRQCMRLSPDLVIIDHVNEMKRPRGKNVNESSWRSDYLKELRDFSIGLGDGGFVLLATVQIRREVHDTVDKVPELRDVRFDDGLVEVSDIVAFLHRDDYYSKENVTAVKIPMKIYIRKNRIKRPTLVNVIYDTERQWLYDYDALQWGGSAQEDI